jgi:hypothetical protein
MKLPETLWWTSDNHFMQTLATLQSPEADKLQSCDLETDTSAQRPIAHAAALPPESYNRLIPSGVGMGTFDLFSSKGKAALLALAQRSAELGGLADEDD